jgi:hypothetical protein
MIEAKEPPVDELNEHLKEVYAHTGFALYGAQLLEQSLANFLMLHGRATGTWITVAQLDALEERLERQTLGNLLNDVRKYVEFDEGIESVLTSALKRRNFLAHHFFKEHATDMLCKSGRNRMIESLKEMETLFEHADLAASVGCKGLQKMLGITDEMLHELYKQVAPDPNS